MKKKYEYRKLAGFGLVGCMVGCLLLGGTMSTQDVGESVSRNQRASSLYGRPNSL